MPIPTQATAAPSPASSNSEGSDASIPPRAGPVLSLDPVPAPRAHSLFRIAAALGPDFGMAIAFLAVLTALVAGFGASFVWNKGPILVAGGILVLLVVVAFVRRAPAIVRGAPEAWRDFGTAARRVVRDWAPFTIIMWAFESMETYTGVIRKAGIDEALYRMDLHLFGFEPTVWVGRLSHPLLTDWMSLTYGLYFILPMIVATALSLRGRRHDLRELSTAVILQMGIGFVLFLLFPAGPPRFYAPLVNGGFSPPQLHSLTGLYELQQSAFDTVDPLRIRSAFPSLHCSIALLTLFYSWRFGDALFPQAPAALLLDLSAAGDLSMAVDDLPAASLGARYRGRLAARPRLLDAGAQAAHGLAT